LFVLPVLADFISASALWHLYLAPSRSTAWGSVVAAQRYSRSRF
jgi:hypothetical protein